MKKNSLIITLFLTSIISITLTVYALGNINARDVIYTDSNNVETNVEVALNNINDNLITREMLNSFGTVTYATSQGTPQTSRTTSKQLSRGKYLIIVTNGITWSDNSGYSELYEEVQNSNLVCSSNNCTIQRLSGYHNQPKASSTITGNYKVIESIYTRAYFVEITEENDTLTATTTSGTTFTYGGQYVTIISIPITMN